MLAVASANSTIILWDVATGQQIGEALGGNERIVTDVGFSVDGQILASASCSAYEEGYCIQGEIRVWDVRARELIGEPIYGHTDWVNNVAFSADGQTLASGSRDGTIILWHVSWQEQACRIAGRNFTWEEWQRYLPDRPYELTCPDLPPHPSAVEAGVIE
jgi:WD40 repeat protein